MPTYEYQCPACGKTFEAFQKITDDPLTKCELCGSAGIRRLISATAFHLKGSGWYKTDYSSGTSSSGGSSSSSASTTTDSGEKKTETKPEASSSGSEAKTTSTPAKTGSES